MVDAPAQTPTSDFFLRSAWHYRDKKQAPHICFRMTLPIFWDSLVYKLILLVSLVSLSFGLSIIGISVSNWLLQPLISQPQVPNLLNSLGIHSNYQLLKVGAFTMMVSLPILLFSWASYGGYAASQICKKMKPAL